MNTTPNVRRRAIRAPMRFALRDRMQTTLATAVARAAACVAAGACTLLFAACALAADLGTPAPAFALPDAGGASVALAALRGRVVYVDFWASWCGPCRRSFPWMNELQQRYGARGLAIVAINVDRKRPDAERFLQQFPATFTVVYDPAGAAPAAYGVPGMPTSYLVDRSGNVVAIEQGFHDERRAPIEARIEALLAGQ
jgi:thiol-disulfide isomerase/thioredoxin